MSIVERHRFVPPEKKTRTSKPPTQENALWTTISVITWTLWSTDACTLTKRKDVHYYGWAQKVRSGLLFPDKSDTYQACYQRSKTLPTH